MRKDKSRILADRRGIGGVSNRVVPMIFSHRGMVTERESGQNYTDANWNAKSVCISVVVVELIKSHQ